MTQVRTALIVGGGIAGPVVAAALRRAGITSTVVEAHAAQDDHLGGTLALAPNGVAALHAIGMDEGVVEHATPISRQVMAFGGKRIAMPSLKDVPPLRVVHRAALHRALYEQAGVPFLFGKRLSGAHETTTGVTATFDDGSTMEADVLIGADGVRSTVRGLIDADAPGPEFTGVLGFEGVSDHEVDLPAGTMTFAFGRRGYYLYWPEPGGGTRWGANLPWKQPLRRSEALRRHDWMSVLREAYGDDDPGGELIRRTDAAALQVVGGLQIMPRVPHWHRGRMVLCGDAAHAPSNSSGQGASLAIESAVQLARCLRDLPDLPAAFGTYERLRRDRVEQIAARAARINHAKAPGPIARTLMPVLMPLAMKAMHIERTTGEEQRYRINWDAPVTS
ncbi:FAD-dependent oxidoreductase [Winogradskya humida]|uniref:FAD-dependent oxidoreductase n=1 Tax=Winogradskya humida TaxID=113566 RepID=A0ABQ3ZZ26_9ACTN|nr:NAD(P)/FAD-dependent oxidoreductase [Actinoplanes humidus]GIE23840.1 FAD-dependent oxidoreductase [Actinoplanes humidus]